MNDHVVTEVGTKDHHPINVPFPPEPPTDREKPVQTPDEIIDEWSDPPMLGYGRPYVQPAFVLEPGCSGGSSGSICNCEVRNTHCPPPPPPPLFVIHV
jgi:hypothetical protein